MKYWSNRLLVNWIPLIDTKTHCLYGNKLVPSDALLHQGPGGVDHVDDHGHHVADEDDDHQELAPSALAAGGALSPVLKLHREGGGLEAGIETLDTSPWLTPFRSSDSEVFLLQHLTEEQDQTLSSLELRNTQNDSRTDSMIWYSCYLQLRRDLYSF